MNFCPFAIDSSDITERRTLCHYNMSACSRQSNKDCGIYADAAAEFKGLIDKNVEDRYSLEFMEIVVYEY